MMKRFKEAIFNLCIQIEEVQVFMAIRQGLTMMIPLIVLGAFSLMIKSLPIGIYQEVLPGILGGKFVELLDFVYAGTFQIFSVALAITTSVSYAMIRNTAKKGQNSVVIDGFLVAVIALISLMGYVGIQYDNFTVSSLGTTNTFMALLIALSSSWLYFKVRDWNHIHFIKRPDTDGDGMYYVAVQSIIPAAIVVVCLAVCNIIFKSVFKVETLQEGLIVVMKYILSGFNGRFGAGLAILVSIHSMWFFGLHGSNVLDPVLMRCYAAIDGIEIYNKTFQDVFVIMGGCGAVLGLTIAILLFSRKKMMKNVSKIAIPCVLFNISEVILFGLPVIFNPIFFLPFLTVPIANYLVSYAAIYLGIVPKVIHQVEWTAPVLLSGYQATGSIAGSLLQLVCLVMDVCMYVPFIKLYETYSDQMMTKKVQQLVKVIQSEEEANVVTCLTSREDTLGSTARRLASDLKGAIRKKSLFMLYQPQVATDGTCIGAEALLRWKHPVAGFIYPPLVIRLTKELGLLHELEEYIFDEAAKAISIVEEKTGRPYKISVNITNESLEWEGFENMVDESVERYRVSRDHLWLEITEQDALSSSIDVANRINSLKKKGHRFLIDDFGMGHTSLLYLQTNNFSVVKIDGTITRNVLKNERYKDILKSIVYLGGLLGFSTVAEFVETKEETELLKEIGVDAFQGYYYSRPIPLDELIDWMKEH